MKTQFIFCLLLIIFISSCRTITYEKYEIPNYTQTVTPLPTPEYDGEPKNGFYLSGGTQQTLRSPRDIREPSRHYFGKIHYAKSFRFISFAVGAGMNGGSYDVTRNIIPNDLSFSYWGGHFSGETSLVLPLGAFEFMWNFKGNFIYDAGNYANFRSNLENLNQMPGTPINVIFYDANPDQIDFGVASGPGFGYKNGDFSFRLNTMVGVHFESALAGFSTQITHKRLTLQPAYIRTGNRGDHFATTLYYRF